jgi:hypothetical protein
MNETTELRRNFMQAILDHARRRIAAARFTLAALGVAALAVASQGAAAQPAGKHGKPSADCGKGQAMTIVGDTPGAISFDVYRQLHPVTAQHLALFADSGQVRMLHDGLRVCTVHDDGVDDPSAVLVRPPSDRMSYWVGAGDLAKAR